MPRKPRDITPFAAYHVLNRSNGKFRIFDSISCYEKFCCLLARASEKHRMPIIAFCIMPNHWHIILRPRGSDHLSIFMAWLCNTHTRRYHVAHETVGQGPLYTGRYKAFLIGDDVQLFTAVRYVERNALAAGLVPTSSMWPWCSVSFIGRELVGLAREPFQMARNWPQIVDEPWTSREHEESTT